MGEEGTNNKKTRNNRGGGRGGGGRGRGGRGRGGRGGGGGGNEHSTNSNFAGRGPKNFGSNNNNNSRAGGGGGPKHFGTNRSRPDCIAPLLPADSHSDDELDNNNDDEDEAAAKIGADSMPLGKEEQVDHIDAVVNGTVQNADSGIQPAPHAYCLICYSSKLHIRRTISPCGHDDVCWQCHLQMRFLHSDKKCPVCKASNESLIVDLDVPTLSSPDANDGAVVHHKRFDQYQLWGNDLGSNFVYREDIGMHFPTSIYEKYVVPLLGFGCGLANCEFTNDGCTYVNEKDMKELGGSNPNKKKAQQHQGGGREVKKRLTGLKALKTHLRIDHGYTLCDLCVENKRDFISKLPRFTPQGLKVHQSKGDGEHSGFSGHPLCEFCRPLRFYDIVKLHEHLNKEHYKCHICDKMGRPNQFFKDYERLERHFDREHYLCHDAQCLQARFVVFENEIDLRGHESSVHGTSRRDGGTKIKLEFRVRREGEGVFEQQSMPSGEDFQFGLNGEAFVPEAMPGEEQQRRQQQQQQVQQENEPEISDPMHAARTAELRAQAASMRVRDGTDGGGSSGSEAFPTLGGAASGIGLVGWTADGARSAAGSGRLKRTAVGKVTREEFPSLGPGPGAAVRKNRTALVGLGRTQTKQPAARTGFSAVASRPNAAFSNPMSSVSYSSSIPVSNAPGMTRDNFPTLGIGSSRPYIPPASSAASASQRRGMNVTTPNLKSADNFPSLGGSSRPAASSMGRSNPYGAAQAHARKLNVGKPPGSAPTASVYPALSNSSDFPPPPSAMTSKNTKIKSAFAAKKPPPMDNVLQFPPPSAGQGTKPSPRSLKAGEETVESLKMHLGKAGYKKLKSLTKDFAMGSIQPEQYVDGAASLFDRGLGDEAFWNHIPSLISDIPNQTAVDRAMRHLESVQMANQMQNMEFGSGGGGGQKKKPINYILPKKKEGNSWANNNSASSGGPKLGVNTKQVSKSAASTKTNNTTKNNASNTNGNAGANNGGGSKKSKTKKKNNELKALAFGM